MSQLTDAERRQALIWIDKRKKFFRWAYFSPYPKQELFLQLGASKRERLLMAANRVGKSEIGAFEATCHATGLYPPWWTGRRFDEPTKGWVCGVSQQAARDVCQVKLCGQWGLDSHLGTGMIPKEHIIEKTLGRGIPGIFDTVLIKHVSGGTSTMMFKSYEQGREKFQGEGLHWAWCDEEPPMDIYSEILTRLGENEGIAWTTFTPLLGRSNVVLRFLDEPSSDRIVVGMTLDDIPPHGHMTAEAKRKLIDGYPSHEREARAKGIPFLGEGRIFTATEESISEPALEHIPHYWVKIWGIDPGIGHPFGAALLIWDKDNDVVHLHHCFRMSEALPITHAAQMKRIGAGVPVAYPKDAADRDMGSGIPLAKIYKQHGLNMLHTHAAWEDGGYSTEAGIFELDERERTGRFKVANHLAEFFEERRFYHRKNGQIVKIKDDILSAVRVGIMMKRYSRQVGLGQLAGQPVGQPTMASGLDFDLFAT